MKHQGEHTLHSTVKRHDHSTMMFAANQMADDIKQRWDRGETPDVLALLAENPELKANRSIVLELAHEEFSRRVDAGEPLDTDEFCRRFPSFRQSLCMLIEVNRLLDQDPRLRLPCDLPDWPRPGESFLDYALIAEIGRGSFARVFLASEPALGDRHVVLKVAPHGGDEAQVAGRLGHPNVVPIHSVTEDPKSGLTAICMPYLGCATLCDVLDLAFVNDAPPRLAYVIIDAIAEVNKDAEPLEEEPRQPATFDPILSRGSYEEGILHLLAQIADALAYTHTRGICHRDLKPSNVLLSLEGKPLLLDFNLSADTNVEAWRVGGTLPYMAPEQLESVAKGIEGPARVPDPRSDLFSLGTIASQLLTGRLPFGHVPQESSVEDVAGALLDRQKEGPEPLRQHNRHVERRVERLIGRCLAFDPDDRPQSAAEVAAALRRELSRPRRSLRWARAHPRRILASVGVLFVGIMAVAIALAMRDPYPIRQFKAGVRYAEQGQYQLAARCLDAAIQEGLEDPEAYFVRGRVRQKLGLYDVAAVDFGKAWGRSRRPELLVCKGYCASKLNQQVSAESAYLQALRDGFRTPALLNNLGCAYLESRDKRDYAMAQKRLEEALEMAPDLQAARINLLLLSVRRCDATGEPVTEAMLDHARKTLQANPTPSGELYRLATALFSHAVEEQPDRAELARETREYVRLAIANGVKPRYVTTDLRLARLYENTPLPVPEADTQSARQLAKLVLLVDPLEGHTPAWSLDSPPDVNP